MMHPRLILLTTPIILAALFCRPAFGQDFSAIETKAKAGDKLAQYQTALHYYHDSRISSYAEALGWFKKAAEQGLPEAAYCLGIMYEEGRGSKKDPQQAKLWYEKAANAGHMKAQYNLGLMLYEGYGVTKDSKAAMQWFQKAAEKGFAKAQYRLGYGYAEGKGLPKNPALAIEWLTKAKMNGDQEAATLLSLIKRQDTRH